MGLDMHLTKKVYVQNWDHRPANQKWEITVKKGGETIDVGNVKYLEVDAGYWRKANHIHHWLVQNIQGGVDECQETYFDQEQMQELLDVINKVQADHILAESLLPTSNGFFFGGTEYDEWYFETLEYTKGVLEAAIADEFNEYYYQSSW